MRPPAPYAPGPNTFIASHVVAGGAFGVEVALFERVKTLSDRLLAMPDFAEAHPFKRKAVVGA